MLVKTFMQLMVVEQTLCLWAGGYTDDEDETVRMQAAQRMAFLAMTSTNIFKHGWWCW